MSDEELRPIADRFIDEYSELYDGNIADVAYVMQRKLRLGYNKANALVDDYIRRHEDGGSGAQGGENSQGEGEGVGTQGVNGANAHGGVGTHGGVGAQGGNKPKPTRSAEQEQAASDFDAALDGLQSKEDESTRLGKIIDRADGKLMSVRDHLDTPDARQKFRTVVNMATKLGYHMVKDGLRDVNDWKEDFNERFGEKAKRIMDMTDTEWDEFLDDIWNNNKFRDGEKRMTLAEWAKEFDKQNTDDNGESSTAIPEEGETTGTVQPVEPGTSVRGDNETEPDTEHGNGEGHTGTGSGDESGTGHRPTGAVGDFPSDDAGPMDGTEPGGNGGGRGDNTEGGRGNGGQHVSGGVATGPDTGLPTSEGGKPDSDTDARPEGGNDDTERGASQHGGVHASISDKTSLEHEKVAYKPRSKGKSLNSVVPAGLNDAMQKNLAEIGDVDEYVMKALGYKSVEEMHKGLAGEQVDGVALALKAMRQGYGAIIADQTGLGKGRQAASILRYAINQGMTPVFFTEKASLFTDLYRDMVNTGNGDKRPFIIASDVKKGTIEYNGETIHLPSDEEYNYFMKEGKLPKGYDYAVVTYSQIFENGGVKEGVTDNVEEVGEKDLNLTGRRKAVATLCKNNIVVMDESHNAAGAESSSGRYCKQIVRDCRGITFLSATYAKRPEQMAIYAMRSVIGDANISEDDLITAIKRGGPVYQEVLARELAESGALVRRERDMSGVTVDWEKSVIGESEQRATYDKAMTTFRRISAYQIELANLVKDYFKKQGVKKIDVRFRPNNSRLFNWTNQLFLGLKVEDAVRRAIEILNTEEEIEVDGVKKKVRGKVFIPLHNTNDAALRDIYDQDQVVTKNDLSSLLAKYLEKSTMMEVNGQEFDPRSIMTPSQLADYNRFKDEIDDMELGMSLSPIDALMEGIRAAGFKVGEITGRGNLITKNEKGETVYTKRQKPKVNDVVAAYNDGDLDVVIVNDSGSTGLSMHAGKEFKDQRKRHCLTIQAMLDVNTEMQIRGRVDRTGQLYHAAYSYLVSHIPAENRLMMMLKTKLKSLDAQTTASQKSEFNEVDTADLANKYGSQVIVDILKEDPTWADRLGDPFGWKSNHSKTEEEARDEYVAKEKDYDKVMKRIALLTCDEQEELYELITDRYASKIEELNATGMNDLEIKNLPLDAETKNMGEVIRGEVPGGKNSFADSTYVEEVEANNQDKPFTKQELKNAVNKSLGGKTDEEKRKEIMDEVDSWGDEQKAKTVKAAQERFDNRMKSIEARIREKAKKQAEKGKPRSEEDILAEIEVERAEQKKLMEQTIHEQEIRVDTKIGTIREALKRYKIGQYISTFRTTKPGQNEHVEGVVVGFEISKGHNPNTSFMTLASSRGTKIIKIPLGDAYAYNHVSAGIFGHDNPIEDWDSIATHGKDRETRYIYTGNLLGALIQNRRGQIVNYTEKDGTVRQGIITPKGTALGDIGRRRPFSEALEKVWSFYKKGHSIITSDKRFTLKYVPFSLRHWDDEHYELSFAKNSKTAEIAKDRGLAEASGQVFLADATEFFESSKTKYTLRIPRDKHRLKAVMEYLTKNYKAEFDDAIDFTTQAAEQNLEGFARGNKYSSTKICDAYMHLVKVGKREGQEFDKDIVDLAYAVFDVAEKLGIKFSFGNTTSNKGVLGYYSRKNNEIRYKYNHIMYGDAWEAAETILHEAIHGVTSYAFYARQAGKPMSKELAEAVDEIIAIQKTLADDPRIMTEYGISATYGGTGYGHEAAAEMSARTFREKLKSINLWEKFKGAVAKVLHALWKDLKLPAKDETAFDRLNKALYKMLDNFDIDLYHEMTGDNYLGEGDEGILAKVLDPKNEEDKKVIDELDKSEKVTGYRNVVLRPDGTFGSPMASGLRTKGQKKATTTGFELGKWEMAEENPQLANDKGKIDLVKPDGKSVAGVDYNPYIHNRPNKVNKQFKQAWERPDLVYIETEIPKSDLDSGYHAEKAAKSVGVHDWNGGKLTLSRYDKPVRIVPWEEVADDWEAEFKDRGVEFDIVPPKLLPILAERGVEILPPHKGMSGKCIEAYHDWKDEKDNSLVGESGPNTARNEDEPEPLDEPTKKEAESAITPILKDLASEEPKLGSEGRAKRTIYEDKSLIDARKEIQDIAKKHGILGNASAGAYNTKKNSYLNGLQRDIADDMIPALLKYRDRLFSVMERTLNHSDMKSDGARKSFEDAIMEVDNAMRWYGEFGDGMHTKIGDHDDAGIRYKTKKSQTPLTKAEQQKVDDWKNELSEARELDTEETKEIIRKIRQDQKNGINTATAEYMSQHQFPRHYWDKLNEMKPLLKKEGFKFSSKGIVKMRTAEPKTAQKREAPAVVRKAAADAINTLGGKGHIHKDYEHLPLEGRQALAKNPNAMGWYNEKTGEVHIYLPNCPTAVEAERTVLHEKVGHEGLRKVVGEENYKKFLMSVWEGVSKQSRHEIQELASRNGMNYHVAVDEWLARKAEDFGTDREKRSTWKKICEVWNDMLHKLGFKHGMSEKDVRKALWLSKHAMENKTGSFDYTARKADFDGKLKRYSPSEGISEDGKSWEDEGGNTDDNLAYRTMTDKDREAIEDNLTPTERSAKWDYEDDLKRASFLWTEAHQNAGRSLQLAYQAIVGRHGTWDDADDCFKQLNQLGSKNQQEMKEFTRIYADGMTRSLAHAMPYFDGKKRKERLQNLEHYVYAKHALERNRVIAVRDFCKKLAKTPTPKGATITNADKAEAFQSDFDTLRESLYGQLESGSITLRDYYKQLDNFIKTEIKDWDAGKNDLSGLSDTETFTWGTGKKGEYDDAKVIDHVMNCEAKMGEDVTGRLWSDINATSQFVRDKDYESGLNNSRAKRRMETMFSWYVPLRGFDATTADQMYYYMHDKGNVVGSAAKKMEGRISASDSPIATLLAMGSYSILKGNRNKAKQALVRFVRKNPNNLITQMEAQYLKTTDGFGNDVLEALYPDFKESMTADEVEQAIQQFKADIEARKANGEKIVTLKDMKTGVPYRIVRNSQKEQHLIHTMINGKDVTLIIHGNPRAAQFVNGDISNYRVPIISWLNSLESQLATSKSLTFMARNAVRDWNYATSTIAATEGWKYNVHFHYMMSVLNGKAALNALPGAVTGVTDTAKKIANRLKNGEFAEPVVEKHGCLNSMRNLFVKYRQGTLDTNNEVERYFKEFCDNGGMTGFVQLQGVDDYKEEIENLLAPSLLKRIKKGAAQVGNVATLGLIKQYFNIVEAVNEAVENQARFCTYYASRKAKRNIIRSIDDAKNISVNFNKSGAGSATMKLRKMGGTSSWYRTNAILAGASATFLKNSMWFYNAGVQGMSRTYQIAMGEGVKEKNFVSGLKKAMGTNQFYRAFGTFCAIPFGAGMIMAFLNEQMAASDDDEDRKKYGDNPYLQLPEYERRDNVCFYLGKGRFMKIPLAIETRAMYAMGDLAAGIYYPELLGEKPIAEQVLQNVAQMTPTDILGGAKVGWNDIRGTILGAVTPSAVQPVVAMGSNIGWTGTPISYVSDWNSKDPKWKHANPRTYEGYIKTAKNLSKKTGGDDIKPGAIDLDPSKLEYLFNAYASGPGKDINEVMTFYAQSTEEDTTGKHGNKASQEGRLPIVKAFYRGASPANSLNTDRTRWYAYLKENSPETYYEGKYEKAGKDIDTSARLASGDPELKIAFVVKRYQKRIKKLEARKNKAKSRADKEFIQDHINETIHNAIEQIDKIEGKK